MKTFQVHELSSVALVSLYGCFASLVVVLRFSVVVLSLFVVVVFLCDCFVRLCRHFVTLIIQMLYLVFSWSFRKQTEENLQHLPDKLKVSHVMPSRNVKTSSSAPTVPMMFSFPVKSF